MSTFKTIAFVLAIGAAFSAGYYFGKTTNQQQRTEQEPTTTSAPFEAVTLDDVPTTDTPSEPEKPRDNEPIDFSNPIIELRNTNGKTISAELLSLNGSLLTIRRNDNQDFSFDMSMLIESDQHYVTQHFAGRPQNRGVASAIDGPAETKEYIIPDSTEYLESLFNEIVQGAK